MPDPIEIEVTEIRVLFDPKLPAPRAKIFGRHAGEVFEIAPEDAALRPGDVVRITPPEDGSTLYRCRRIADG